jgi:uncharacterized protein (DUF1778 family)
MGSTNAVEVKRKPLGVRVTPEQHRILTEAAKREHRSVNSFVIQAAMQAAQGNVSAIPRKTPEQIKALLNAARAKVHIPGDRDILEEFLAERRAEAARE